MNDSVINLLLLPGFFISIVLFIEIGRWLGIRFVAEETERARAVFGTIEGAILGLLGLMVAFTFSGAASRFDARRSLIVEEANAIGTAYLRLDLLPPASQPPLRDKFRRYTEARIAVYQALPDIEASNAHAARAVALQGEIWADAVPAVKDVPASSMLVLPALNEMIDITTTRSILLKTHIPTNIMIALILLTQVCALLIGYGLPRGRTLAMMLHTYGFAIVVTVMMYVIFDLDHPRFGLIRLDYADQAMSDVLASMK